MEKQKIEEFLENQVKLQKEKGKRYVEISGLYPPTINGELLPVKEVQDFGQSRNYKVYFMDEMSRPFYGSIRSWDECHKVIIEFEKV